MGEETGLALRELLPAKIKGIESAMRHELEGAQPLAGKPLAWGFLASQASEKLHETLDIDIFSVLAGSWAKLRELHEYTEEERHPKDELSVVHLGKHEFTHTLHPVVELVVAAQTLHRLPLVLHLTATIETVSLGVRNKHIVSFGGGAGTVSAVLKYKDQELHRPIESRKVPFYDSLELKPGVLIA